jgi:hypothetical protein
MGANGLARIGVFDALRRQVIIVIDKSKRRPIGWRLRLCVGARMGKRRVKEADEGIFSMPS